MIVKQIIKANPEFIKNVEEGESYLNIAEFFFDTIQGEGVNMGCPAAFLRLQGCTQNCIWCDTQEVWRQGNPYTFDEIFGLMEEHGLIEKLKEGQHLVLTGGSPLKQQKALLDFLDDFEFFYGFIPYIEIENECTLMPYAEFEDLVNCWNNSPKLSNSGNPDILRYQPKILKYLSSLPNSWFKFVVSTEEDLEEIKRDYLDKELILKEQVILMPRGGSKDELEKNREFAIEKAVEYGFRYTTREHVAVYGKMTGV